MRDHEEEWLELCRQASVEQDREKLFQLVRRINDLLDAKDRRLQESTPVPASGNNRVFQIAYDAALLVAREELLREHGYEVRSVLGNEEAQRALDRHQSFRLFIVGHAAPREAREEMLRWLKTTFPHTRIMALNPPQQAHLGEADYNVALNGPEGWLSIVANVPG